MDIKEKGKTYSTYGGVVTEDTLSFEDKRELKQKKENKTLYQD